MPKTMVLFFAPLVLPTYFSGQYSRVIALTCFFPVKTKRWSKLRKSSNKRTGIFIPLKYISWIPYMVNMLASYPPLQSWDIQGLTGLMLLFQDHQLTPPTLLVFSCSNGHLACY